MRLCPLLPNSGELARLPTCPMASGPPLHISQYGLPGCVCIRERKEKLFSNKFPAPFLSKISSSIMLNHTAFSMQGRDAITTRFLFFLEAPGKKEGITSLRRKDLVLGGG
ncbi:hypothetical protein AVEN_116450-1 [Araneus ventricosus]|uniref:Uncharacterized protein n=1 Tax=Araneus ventricosus TaxID=182803 RepID=A0A4Y2L0W5_ARAVE|nr:hypothetical protein AVEN_116450-1 [Araneus ventricosus]